jgi:UDP-2,3-diacylglucosamine pyrophosphatase LpxH
MLRFCSVRLDTLAPILKAMMALLNLDTRCLQRIAFSTHGVIIYLCCNHDKVCIKAKFLQLLENSFVETQNAIKIRGTWKFSFYKIYTIGLYNLILVKAEAIE